MRYLLVVALLVVASRPAFGQHMERIQAMWEAKMKSDADQKAIDNMRRVVKRQFNEQAKEVVPLDPIAKKQWKEKLINRRTCWVWEIKKQNVTTNQIVYNPSMGYVVDREFRKVKIYIPDNGSETVDFGWFTLDEALVKKFGDSDQTLARLPEIPGWGRYYDLTSDDQIAEIKRRAAIETREQAILATGKRAGEQIGEVLAPEIANPVVDALKKPTATNDPLALKQVKVDPSKTIFQTTNGKYFVHQYKDGSYEVFDRDADGSTGKSHPQLFESLKELRDYLRLLNNPDAKLIQ